MPIPWAAGYTAAKFALAGFTDALRQELGSAPASPSAASTTRLTAVATRGGWGEPQRTRVRRAVSGIGLVAAAGAAVGLLRYRSASGQAVPRQCDA